MDSLKRVLRSVWKKDRSLSGDGDVGSAPRRLNQSRIEILEALSERLGYRFQDLTILDQALTHRSFVNNLSPLERQTRRDYENLEFLGDAVLGLFISEYLLMTFPEDSEGGLTKMRAYLVSTERLQQLSRKLDLGDYIQISPGEEKTGGRRKRTILADLFESVIAAIYLDGGSGPARTFVFREYAPLLQRLERGDVEFKDFKSELQEVLHSMGHNEPSYQTVTESGPDHQKEFLVELRVDGRPISQGRGRSKKRAEQNAAQEALKRMEGN